MHGTDGERDLGDGSVAEENAVRRMITSGVKKRMAGSAGFSCGSFIEGMSAACNFREPVAQIAERLSG